MSRAKATDVSSPISLFPFIGVLLSTMGALLVVLICVSRSARDSAVRDAAARQAAAAAEGQHESREELEKVRQFLAKLGSVRSEAEKQLRDDQLRLSHIEDHIRRTQEKAQSLQDAAVEMARLENEHYDDRQQAEREIERLGQLIASTRESIADVRAGNQKTKRCYAIIPYEGPHGTRRRPIYIECRQDEVLLQPEGIRLTAEDFRPPLGAGNPLAAALRASREYIFRQEGGSAAGADTEPYPLILVRPEGILAYYRVRDAIESWDAAFGYELIDNDWKLEFPPVDPLLADIEQQAVEQSRTRQQMLIAAAPRAYGPYGSDDSEEFADDQLTGDGGFDDEEGSGYGDGFGSGGAGNSSGSGSGGPYAVDADENYEHGEFLDHGVPNGSVDRTANNGNHASEPGSGGAVESGLVTVPGTGSSSNGSGAPYAAGNIAATAASGSGSGTGSGVPQTPQPGAATSIVAGTGIDGSDGARRPITPLPPNATGASLASGVGEANLTSADRTGNGAPRIRAPRSASASNSGDTSQQVPLDQQLNLQRRIPASARGHNWAIQGKTPTSVPIRRTIHVVVRSDRIALQPDSARGGSGGAGKEIRLQGSTTAQLDDFVAAVQERVHDWGLAGSGMYWRPVLLLDADAAGQGRADDLARLLQNSGIDVRNESAANRTTEGDTRATR